MSKFKLVLAGIKNNLSAQGLNIPNLEQVQLENTTPEDVIRVKVDLLQLLNIYQNPPAGLNLPDAQLKINLLGQAISEIETLPGFDKILYNTPRGIPEAKKHLVTQLSDVRDTTTLVKKFLFQLSTCNDLEKVDALLFGFKEIYSNTPYYQDVKHSILREVEFIGINPYHAEECL